MPQGVNRFPKNIRGRNLCLKDSNCSQTKIMGLKNSLNEQSNEFSTVDIEIINVLEAENVETDVLESMKIT